MTDNPAYSVLWSSKAVADLRVLRDKVIDPARRSALAGAIRILDQRLRDSPLLVGEIYRQTGTIAEHLAVYDLLAIDFAVDVSRNVVFVRYVRALSKLDT